MDAYDVAVMYFKKHPDEIHKAWDDPKEHTYGYLFSFMGSNRWDYGLSRFEKRNKCWIGCPSLIKGSYMGVLPNTNLYGDTPKPHSKKGFVAQNEELTKLCQKARMPGDMQELLDEHGGKKAVPYLNEFARLQRIADKELRRKAPEIPLVEVVQKVGT